MVGSLVPTSSILRLTISIDCFNAELLIVNNPNLEKLISISLLLFFYNLVQMIYNYLDKD